MGSTGIGNCEDEYNERAEFQQYLVGALMLVTSLFCLWISSVNGSGGVELNKKSESKYNKIDSK